MTRGNPSNPGRAIARLDAPRRVLRWLWDVVSTAVLATLMTLLLNVFAVQAITIDGPSMQPNLRYDQRVMTEKLTYRFIHGPQRGDVVVVKGQGKDIPLIKRVVALPGETIEVHDGRVYVDGQLTEEPWVAQHGGPDCRPTLVPSHHVFILGDNRPNSHDSRAFGPVHVDDVIGRALFIYWPLKQADSLIAREGP